MAKFVHVVGVAVVVCGVTFISPARAQEEESDASQTAEILAGHSAHGEAFNEGPRQKAYLMGGTGAIHFDVTCDPAVKEDVQRFVEQGIGQLHGFWYFEAERSFRQAAMLDPECAICYWGMAMANTGNGKRAKEFLAKAMELRSHTSEREAMYIDALDDELNGKGDKKEKAKRLIATYEAIAQRYPEDLEAKAWLGYALYKRRGDAGKKYEEVEAALKDVHAVEPLHPVHHYLIHLWDLKDAARALPSAARCGQSSPGIAHMWHMPGHIYSRLKRYEDAVWQQEASARTDHAHMMRDRVLPDEIHNFAHNNEWLIRNLVYIGRWRDAVDLAKNMIELPRHPKYNTLSRRNSTYYGRVRLFDVLKRYELWGELVALTDSPYLEPTDNEEEQVRRLEYRGIALAELNHVDKAQPVVDELNVLLDEARAKAEEEKRKNKGKKNDKKKKRGQDPVERLEKAVAAVEGRLAVAFGDYVTALPLLKKAGEDKFFQARVHLLAGDKEDALKMIADEVKSREKQVHPLAVQVELLWLAGEKEQAKNTLEELRKLSGSIQLGTPVFDRLQPIAVDLGLPSDWRVASTPAKDTGIRPPLDELGPFRWSPSPAPAWKLKDFEGKEISLTDYRGRPVIVIFYLGFGCLHCAEQLQAMAPMTEKFKKEGISLVAISSDDAKGLKMSVDNYEGGMPFPLVSNEPLDVFKAYRVYDDFEKTPLHGTFVIDGKGQVLWQDISYEPFMDVKFLLEESQRLLNQSKPLPQMPQPAQLARVERVNWQSPLHDLARIDPAGIGGSLVLAGDDLPEAALETFLRLAHGKAAKIALVTLDSEDATKAVAERLLKHWNDGHAAQLRLVRLGAAKDVAAELQAASREATGLWLAGADEKRWQELFAQADAKKALADFLASGGAIGTAGTGSAMLASAEIGEKPSADSPDNLLALLPDAIVDTHSSGQESPSRLEKSLDSQPHRIGYEIDTNAALVVHGRRLWKAGEGAVRIRVGADDDKSSQITLAGNRDAADLTALRRTARDKLGKTFPPSVPQAGRVEDGAVIMIGGGGMPKGIIARFIELAGGKDSHIVILPTAMPDPVPQQNGIADEFRKAGAKSVTVLPERTLDKVESEEYLAALKKATGIWFGGGREWRFADAYQDTKAHEAMRDVIRRGGVVMGSSAGASIQADYLARGNPLGNRDIMAAGYERGLGFLPGVAVDQHFTQRNRENDMLSLVKRYPQLLGIGIDESTALIVEGETGEVTGRGDVHFYDARANASDVAHHVAAAGQQFNLVKRSPVPQPDDPRTATPKPPIPCACE